mmetsp:Transcript_53934/g.128484  ORF Transcript_53934/g.128484 Transcript_53934/m.128484 type:complete len:84 (+) Transcript_53934:29-280(+)
MALDTSSIRSLRRIWSQSTAKQPIGGHHLSLDDFLDITSKTQEEVMRELDTNGSGHIEYQEFETYLVAEHRKAADRRSPSKPR